MKDQRHEREATLNAQQQEGDQQVLLFSGKSEQEKAAMKKEFYKNVAKLRRKSAMK